MINRKAYRQPPFLLGFAGGVVAMLLIMAVSSTSFQYFSHGHGSEKGLSVNSGSYQVGISGFVPTICRVSVPDSPVSNGNGLFNLGQMNEFCNDGHGYRIYIDHPASASGAAVIVDGRRVPLSAQGSTMIFESNGPGNRSHKLSLDASSNPDAIGGLWFRIKPI